MLNANEYLDLKTKEYNNNGTAYASLAGFYEACIWLRYTEEETQARLDEKCAEMKAKVNA